MRTGKRLRNAGARAWRIGTRSLAWLDRLWKFVAACIGVCLAAALAYYMIALFIVQPAFLFLLLAACGLWFLCMFAWGYLIVMRSGPDDDWGSV